MIGVRPQPPPLPEELFVYLTSVNVLALLVLSVYLFFVIGFTRWAESPFSRSSTMLIFALWLWAVVGVMRRWAHPWTDYGAAAAWTIILTVMSWRLIQILDHLFYRQGDPHPAAERPAKKETRL